MNRSSHNAGIKTHRPILLLMLAVWLMMNVTVGQATTQTWRETAPLITARAGAGVLVINGMFYAVGGVDGVRFLNTSEYTALQADGTLAAWRAGSAMNEARGFFGVAAHHNFIYAVGGGNGPNGSTLLRSVERAAILADGALGPWQREPQPLRLPRRCAKIVVMGDYLYALGGYSGALLDSVERARLHDDGSLGAWELLDQTLTVPRYIYGAAQTASHIYIAGGHAQQGGDGESAVEWLAIQYKKQSAEWQSAPALHHGRYGLSLLAHGNHLYALGGLSGATFHDVIETSAIGADGAPMPWQETTPLPLPLADFGAVVVRDRLYVIGGTNRDGYFNSVFVAAFDAQGDLRAALNSEKSGTAPAPAQRLQLPHAGVITEALDGGTYIYLEVDNGDGREWLAAARMAVRAGDRVRYSEGILMRDFFSKQLQRRFDAIRFVGKLEAAE
ncbi:MAG: hypothetical protein AABZ84_02150 [Pseudomonadota bacterium]